MSLHFSPDRASFHDDRLGPVPVDAVAIDAETHTRLLAARSAGATIALDDDGRPVATMPPRPAIEERRARAVAAVKREASCRILAVAPLWRQMNDARDLPLSTGAARTAIENRLAAIDAIRAASDLLEHRINAMGTRGLAQVDVAAPSHWPA